MAPRFTSLAGIARLGFGAGLTVGMWVECGTRRDGWPRNSRRWISVALESHSRHTE